ncbi:hypothetical protein KR222_010814 [Zaprionus bogoriensis]|nr:hypothetical protein KR222_010814 [Zaprionus bogoriensis]
MATLIAQIIVKQGLRDEPNVLEKTTELIRLLELRSSNVPLHINEYGKIVLCMDLACSLLGIGFDKVQALKLSALRKSHYENNKRMFEKLLDLNKLLNANHICVQLGLNGAAQKADELLALFKAVSGENSDADHPQYPAMAVFHACRLLRIKVSKSKLMAFSNLRPTQWQQLEQQWQHMITKHHKEINITSKLKDQIELSTCISVSKKKDNQRVDVEDYEKWKSRMLEMAKTKLNEKPEPLDNI